MKMGSCCRRENGFLLPEIHDVHTPKPEDEMTGPVKAAARRPSIDWGDRSARRTRARTRPRPQYHASGEGAPPYGECR